MRALVTGADGFVGQWLLRALLDAGDAVAGTTHHQSPKLTTLEPEKSREIGWQRIDLRDQASLERAVASARPDVIFHLAAQSSGALSFRQPIETFETNVMGTLRLLEAARKIAPGVLVIVTGSSEVYGSVSPVDVPLDELAPLRPHSPYASSKAAAESIALQYARTGWLRVIVTRSFNHTGPGQDEAFVVPGFAKQIAELRRNPAAPLQVGNLAAQRDFTDVRDVVDAYRTLAQRGVSGNVYNVCSGRAVSMREILNKLAKIAGLGSFVTQEDPERMRPVDAPIIVGDPTALERDTGWKPGIPLDRTLADVYEWCARRA